MYRTRGRTTPDEGLLRLRSIRRLLALLILPVAACVSTSRFEPSSTTDPPPAVSLQVSTSGQSVLLVLQISNTASTAREITYPTGQTYDFVVRDGDREIWRWSEGRAFSQAIRTETVGPGETLRFQEVWSPGDLRGDFTVVGVLTSSDHRVEQSARITLP